MTCGLNGKKHHPIVNQLEVYKELTPNTGSPAMMKEMTCSHQSPCQGGSFWTRCGRCLDV